MNKHVLTLVNVDDPAVRFPSVYQDRAILQKARKRLIDNEFLAPHRLKRQTDTYGYEETSQNIVFVSRGIQWTLDAHSYLPKRITFLTENEDNVKQIEYVYEAIRISQHFPGYDVTQADVYEQQYIFDAQGWKGHIPWRTYFAGAKIGVYTLHEVNFIERKETTPAKVTVWRYCRKDGKECNGSVLVIRFLKASDLEGVRSLLADHDEKEMKVHFFGDTMVRIDFPEDTLKLFHIQNLRVIYSGGEQ